MLHCCLKFWKMQVLHKKYLVLNISDESFCLINWKQDLSSSKQNLVMKNVAKHWTLHQKVANS